MWKGVEDIEDMQRVSEATYEDAGSLSVIEYWDKWDYWEDFKREDDERRDK